MRNLWMGLLVALLSSCSFQATMTLSSNGSAETAMAIKLEPSARQAWQSLRDLDPSLPADPFDPSLWRKGLGSQGQVTVSGGTTRLTLAIPDLKRFVPTWKTEGDVWEGTIDRATLRRWANLTEWATSPALDSLVPAQGTRVTEADYRDLLVYLLGPQLSETAARAVIDASTVQLTIHVPRALRSAPGAASISDQTVVYRWPLVRVLAMETPIKLRLVF